MSNAIYHKSSKGRPAYIVKDGERVATFLQQPTYENGVKMANALSDLSQQAATLEHGTPQEQVVDDLLALGKPIHHNPRSLSHAVTRYASPLSAKVSGSLGDDDLYTAHNVQL